MAKQAEEAQAAERSAITHPARAEVGESPPPEAAGTQAAGRERFKTEHFIEVRCTNTSSRVGQWKDQKPLPHERKLQTRIGKNKRCSSNRRNQLQSRIEAVCLTRQGFHWRYSEATCSRRMRHQEERILLPLSEEKEQMRSFVQTRSAVSERTSLIALSTYSGVIPASYAASRAFWIISLNSEMGGGAIAFSTTVSPSPMTR